MSLARTIAGACLIAAAIPAAAGTVSPALRDAMNGAGPDDRLPIVVLMDEFPDRDLLLEQVRGMRREQRRAHVIATMKALAGRTQRAAREIAGPEARVLWGVNGLALDADARAIERLASLPEVRWVLHDRATAHADGGITGPTGGDGLRPQPERHRGRGNRAAHIDRWNRSRSADNGCPRTGDP